MLTARGIVSTKREMYPIIKQSTKTQICTLKGGILTFGGLISRSNIGFGENNFTNNVVISIQTPIPNPLQKEIN